MKKLMFLVSAMVLTGSAFAQKGTTDNPFTLEGAVNFTTNDGFDFQAPNVRMRYFLKDNMAGRLILGYMSSSANDSNSVSSNAIGLGFEYHLAGNDKMSPYFNAGVNFGGGKVTVNNIAAKTGSLGVGINAGVDYYVSENIYVGLEIGLLNYSTNSTGEGDTKITISGLNLGGGSAIRMGWRF
jgi:outer membrane protein W